MRFCSIASGSSGNCIYVGSDNTHVLVDITFTEKDEVKVQVVPYAEVILEPEFGLKPETKN